MNTRTFNQAAQLMQQPEENNYRVRFYLREKDTGDLNVNVCLAEEDILDYANNFSEDEQHPCW